MSHDVKKNKLLKKIIGLLGYKIINKESAKTERLIDSFNFNITDFIKFLINSKKIKEVIQIGANDGKSDDFLRDSIAKDTKVLLVEPIESAFVELKKNYLGYQNVKFINKAIDILNGKKTIYLVNPKYYQHYKKKYKSENVEWLTVLASFNKDHLSNHGIKLNHITSYEIDCITFNDLIVEFNFKEVGLLVIDTEGHDYALVKDFIEKTDLRPVIIFEWIHMHKNEAENLMNLLKREEYKVLKIDKDLICFQNNFFLS